MRTWDLGGNLWTFLTAGILRWGWNFSNVFCNNSVPAAYFLCKHDISTFSKLISLIFQILQCLELHHHTDHLHLHPYLLQHPTHHQYVHQDQHWSHHLEPYQSQQYNRRFLITNCHPSWQSHLWWLVSSQTLAWVIMKYFMVMDSSGLLSYHTMESMFRTQRLSLSLGLMKPSDFSISNMFLWIISMTNGWQGTSLLLVK